MQAYTLMKFVVILSLQGKIGIEKSKSKLERGGGLTNVIDSQFFFFSYFSVIIFFEDCNTDMQLL